MKTLIAALAGAALLTAPMAAQAQSHGGSHGGGGFHGGAGHVGGFRGGGFRGGGFRGGFGGFRDPFFFGAGLGLGFYYADPWFWGPYPYYGYYGYPAYYDYDYDYDGPSNYYRGSMPNDDGPSGAPGGSVRAAPGDPRMDAPAPKACGTWRWDQAAQKYNWVTDGC